VKEINGYNPSKDPRLINCKTECGNERCYAKRYGLFAEKTCPYFAEPLLPESPVTPAVIKTGIYDIEEIHPNCTVQIWRNSQTGEESIGWWPNE
jgi:hypothetical protein